jgi:ankyrin repeat protein/L-ascorbate metabolism protein UlaG (beta-lactamase superfamily)
MSTRTLSAVVVTAVLAWAVCASAGEIHQAIRDGNRDLVRQLIAQDPSLVSAPDENPTRDLPLHTAALTGDVAVAETLVAAGAAVDGGDADDSTPLDVAAMNGQREMVTFLIGAGADVNHRDNNGAYSLSFAAFGNQPEIVAQLLESGADLAFTNANGITLLHAAAARGLDDFYTILLADGADVDATTHDGDTPLHWAARWQQVAMIERLVADGADVAIRNEHGQTALMASGFQGEVPVAEALLAAGADPDAVDENGSGALMYAAWRGRADYAAALLAGGADPDRRDANGATPLISAARGGHSELVAVLLGAGAKVDIQENRYGCTALHAAAIAGYADIVAELLAHDANPMIADWEGRTPLELAEQYDQKHAAADLVACGAVRRRSDGPPANPGACCRVDSGEAAVWYLGHSAWAVKTDRHLLVFDYWDQGREPDDPCLCNGHIVPAELADLNVAVFVSHEHGDHYDPSIFAWREQIPAIDYYLGCRPADADGLPYHYVGPRETRTIDGMQISTITSNDSGVGWVIDVDGIQIYHAGDHANRQQDFSGPYRAEIDHLAAAGVRPDLAFMPISGCGFGDQEAVKLGVHYALENLRPAVFLPMHAGNNSYRYQEFVGDCRGKYPLTKMVAVQNRGDHFLYSGGEIGQQASLTR